MFETKVTKMLGIEYPLIGGTMMSITDADFTAAISNAGGLGILASAIYKSAEDFEVAVNRVQELTDKPFAVNINLFPGLVPIDNNEVKYALKVQSLGVDIVTVVGYENGGATGKLDIGTLTLIPSVVDALDIPVIGGGGVSDARGFLALRALGAEGIIMGTRLMLTKEAPLHDKLKDALLNASETDTMLVMRSIGATHRVWNNVCAQHILDLEAGEADMMEIFSAAAGEKARQMYQEGDLDVGMLSCGQGVGLAKDIPSVKELFDRIISEASGISNNIAPN